MKRTVVMVGALLVAMNVVWAQERGAPAGQPATAPERRGDTPEEYAKRLADRQAQMEKELASIDGQMARIKDIPDAAAIAAPLKTAMTALNDNLKAQVEAVKAGDTEKAKGLSEQGKGLEVACNKARAAADLFRRSAELRAIEGRVPPATGDAAAARQKLVESANALADFYAQQAKNPPESAGGRGQPPFPPELQVQESTLRANHERARIEFEFQNGLAKVKELADKSVDVPAVKSACDQVQQKAMAAHDAQLKVLEAQEAYSKAMVARREADGVLEKAMQEQDAAMRQKLGGDRSARGAADVPNVPRP